MSFAEAFDLIPKELAIVVVACWVLGYILKNIPKVADWTIIFILLPFAIGFSIWLTGFGPLQILHGILSAAVASYGYDIFKQLKDRS